MIRATSGRTFAVLVLAKLGCASCASPRATWYYQSEPKSADEVLYLTIVNDTREPLEVNRVIVNGGGSAGEGGWDCEFKPTTEQAVEELQPGRLIVIPLSIFKVPCVVPIGVSLVSTDNKATRVDLPSTMPSALPRVWRDCPLPYEPQEPESPSPSTGSATGKAAVTAPAATPVTATGGVVSGTVEKAGQEKTAKAKKRESPWSCKPLAQPSDAATKML